jgi:hypothetical protein
VFENEPLRAIFQTKRREPNIEVEWLAFLLCTREILDSNLGLEAGYPN